MDNGTISLGLMALLGLLMIAAAMPCARIWSGMSRLPLRRR